jgi:heme-degrading monooxygenase HmoA
MGRLMEGFEGMIALVDRHSGKTLGITFWESEEAMRASEEAANRLREESSEVGGEEIAGVERYEVGNSVRRGVGVLAPGGAPPLLAARN